MPPNKLPNQKPSKAQRSAQSARDKKSAQARMGASSSSRSQAKGRARRANPGGIPPVAGFFAPVSEGTIMKSVKPVFQRSSFMSQRIIHREKVAKLTSPGTGTFTVLGTFPLNPGMPQTFPWLSNEAQGWESYRFNRLRFIWVPTSGTAVAGNIIMAPDYDAADAAPVGETFMSSYSDCEEANIWARFAAELENALLNGELKRHYVRLGALAANLDIKMYDSGNFFVCSADDAVANSGKLWVEYDVELFNPQVPPGGFQASGAMQAVSGLTAAAPFGTTATQLQTGPIAISAANQVVTLANVQVGQEVLVSAGIQGTVITVFTGAATSGCTLRADISATTMVNAAGTGAVDWQTYVITAPNPTITYSTTATTVTTAQIVATVLAPIPGF